MSDDIDDELDRLRQHLQAVVKGSGLSVRALERKLGIKGGSTRKILKGEITLSVRHVLLILKALGMPYAEFFRAAYLLSGEPAVTPLPSGPAREAAASLDETRVQEALGRLLVKTLREQVLEPQEKKED